LFFESLAHEKGKFATDEKRQEFARDALEHFAFLYSDTNSTNAKVHDIVEYYGKLAHAII